MKKALCLFSFILAVCVTALAQDKFDSEQLKLRSDIESFLREEGFMPQLDSDGDLKFKKEGDIYYIVIDNRDHSPFYVAFSKYFSYGEKFTRQKISGNLDKLNMKKGVKTILFDSSYAIQAQLYLTSAEHFKYVFYKLLKQLDALETEISDICSSTSSDTGLHSYGAAASGGTMLVNENFSAASSAWYKDGGELSFKNGKMIFKDLKTSTLPGVYFNLPQNLKYENFQVDFSMKSKFPPKYTRMYFLFGSVWNKSYKLGLAEDNGLIDMTFGNGDDNRKYYPSTTIDNLSAHLNHIYRIIKKGRKVECYADGKLLFSVNIDLIYDINIMGFMANENEIEVDYITVKLL